ncbi:hypothetical protein CLAFUW4_14405 [Fulvia fulva]|uniref:Uncharacterized protein n=1 Tax=Passalora fulva TaxID=5499 RepID=A0A9Q8PM63_PASFU|nr:uncharacterized protein CLAFUR5_14235 [Fulvia fulva]KAK4609404.1 hypothetical protein CLAFUR4_14401 [Fulvia fulva]KAK4609560.1 hypothetical protein CLAFUR0_14405 [Fulvia fulva]UJO24991.1 hypothetical protein CLAFUR5_14235 [Fulvia fulva]WPV22950.1 hypothetical protein CLAFUW4_14405 [Fulvia fulva]WPV37928.1 hypothetical protein CLAFUW7_14410 [Fulvia fulva]
MPNPNTGAVNPVLEPEALPENANVPVNDVKGSSPEGKYGDKNNKKTEGGRENQEQTRKAKSSKNNNVGDDTSAKK